MFWLDSADGAVATPAMQKDTAPNDGAPNMSARVGGRSMLTLELRRVAELSASGVLRFDRPTDDLSPESSLWDRLDAFVRAFRRQEADCPAGLVAWMSYSCGFLAPEGGPKVAHPRDIPMLELFETRAALVEQRGQTYLVTRASSKTDAQRVQERWIARFDEIFDGGKGPSALPPDVAPLDVISLGSRDDYIEGISRIQRHIAQGEVEQVCLTYPIAFKRPPAMANWYMHLRERSPAGYCAFVRTSALECASTSPECLFEIEGRTIWTRPMKGTRKRGAQSDAALAEDLRNSPKDRAENAMISELVKRDLEEVCRVDSVHIRAAFTVETYATVLQMTSTVEGQLHESVGPFGAYSALSPPASMTGTPRARACEILNELETSPRGLYSGSIAWIDGGSRAQFSVVIRAMQAWGAHAAWHVGGGIIAASDPADEWTESRTKALALFPDGAPE